MRAEVIIDLQFGSTGKGAVAAYLVNHRKYDSSIRVQSIQAGHTIYYRGNPYKMRTIPCAWVNPNVKLILGAGCFIEKQLLLDEIAMINKAMPEHDVRDRLYIDYRAFYITEEDRIAEESRHMAETMGSTAHGAGSSLIRKMWRAGGGQVKNDFWAESQGLKVCNTIEMIQHERVLVEGCQGTLLAMHTSPYYPYTTARECTVSGIIAEAGISPFDVTEVHGVFRSYPIRVGGPSGPTGGKELDWKEINLRAGREIVPETTTVTGRTRRIFEFSDADFNHALMINKPTQLYMTFADYLAPGIYGQMSQSAISDAAEGKLAGFVQKVMDLVTAAGLSAKMMWIGTGEQENMYLDSGYIGDVRLMGGENVEQR